MQCNVANVHKINTSFLLYLALPDIHCYIHSVSPVKKSGGSNFINCDIQTPSAVVRGVCFAVDKKQTLDALAHQKSHTKISNYSISTKYGSKDIVMNKQTILTPLTTATFDYKTLNNANSIATLWQVAPEQLVTIKGKVTQLSATKTVILQTAPVKNQPCYLIDPSGFMKLILWGSHTDTIEQNQTYVFNNIRVKVTKDERYLNTPKSEQQCTITEAAPFVEALPVVDVVSSTIETTAQILGVTNVTKNQCCSCYKKIVMKWKLAFCENCKMSQKSSRCNTQWYLRIYVEVNADPQKKLRLSVFNDAVKKLQNLCKLVEMPSEESLIESILELDTLMITYDCQTNKLIDVELLDI